MQRGVGKRPHALRFGMLFFGIRQALRNLSTQYLQKYIFIGVE
jgi:hypothetical protein